ncbi:dyslexia-associated protein KIAA0319-like protein [Kryptolebias marmoratus]|uniref:dyslexia-associated protein KIAA0319-like protein n=1 Tax=Kryptolebias marmoratus TaxID=37003 RepID=UPI0018ACF587|nr:dyslexia-associated protein KIAA0319-like protein [Kryptolebias marmoratus]
MTYAHPNLLTWSLPHLFLLLLTYLWLLAPPTGVSAGLCRVTGGVLGIHWSSTVGLGWYPLASGRGGATCWESCCLKPSCGAAWSLGGRCVLLSCSRSGGCPIASLPQPHEESLGLLQLLSKEPVRMKRRKPRRAQQAGSYGTDTGRSADTETVPTAPSTATFLQTAQKNLSLSANRTSDGSAPSSQQNSTINGTIDPAASSNATDVSDVSTSTAAATTSPTPTEAVRELVVSAGEGVEVTLPRSEVELNAYVVPPPPPGSSYTFDWRLITHPKDYSGEMEGKKSRTLKLSKLTVGLYEFGVTVDGEGAHGEGYVNVTVKPEPRVNKPPVVVVSPKFQEISLPTSSTVIDGSRESVPDAGTLPDTLPDTLPNRLPDTSPDTLPNRLPDTSPDTLPDMLPHTLQTRYLTRYPTRYPSRYPTCYLTRLLSPPLCLLLSVSSSLPPLCLLLFLLLLSVSSSLSAASSSSSSGPDGVKIENADGAVAVVTGLEVGSYKFTLTVTDERNLQSSDTVKVIVREEEDQPPVARVLSSPPVSLPVRTAVLDGSHSTDDKGGVSFLWTRDDSSPAAGDVLNNSDHQAVLFLGNLVEGKYMFTLTVTDSKGQSSSDRGAVEVRADLWERDLVELLMEVPVSQVSQRQRDMLLRQVGVLLGVLDSDIIVREISAFNERSTRLVFLVSGGPDRPPLSGRSVALSLRNKLRKQKNDFLIFKARRVDTVVCQMNCSGHGECDPFTRSCVCHPFWMENFIRAQLGDAESNCEWSVLYVTIASFMMVVSVATVVWLTVCCCNRRRSKARRSKSRYKMLEADERDGLELQLPRAARLKPVPPPTSSALMHSDSEFDSDEGQERGHLLRPQNGSLRNGQGPPRALKPREEHL